MPYRFLDDGYNLGWRSQLPGEDSIERPSAVERQHSWVWLLPQTYLKRASIEHPGGALQGQFVLFEVRAGLIFLGFGIATDAHLSKTRRELYRRNDNPPPIGRLLLLEPGDVL